MKANRALKRLAAVFVLFAAPIAHAQEDGAAGVVADIRLPQRERDVTGLLPIERVLEGLGRSKGFSFVFDSRLLSGKQIPVVEPSANVESDLSDVLKSVRLRLHKVAPNSFAITGEAATPAPSAPYVEDRRAAAPAPIDTILVVGSTASMPTSNGAKRLFTIDADDLAFLGAVSPAEAIYDLPQSLASFTPSNSALFGSAAGLSLADLRGLNPRRTMVLMNGRRRTLTSGGNGDIGGADLGAFAEPLLERIEVQNAPAGARFGGGAVAGTINFVTRTGFEGVEAGGRFGISERGDSEAVLLHALAGRTFEGVGNLTVGLAAARSEGLVAADREFSDPPYGFALDGRRSNAGGAEFLPGFGRSGLTERGLFAGVVLADGTFARFPGGAAFVPGAAGVVDPFVGSLDQLYSLGNTQSITLPSDQLSGIASFEAEPSDVVKVFLELNAGVSTSEVSLLPLPAFQSRGVDPFAGDAAVIPLDNPFLPQSIRDIAQANFGSDAASLIFERRYAELGPRRSDIDRRAIDFAAGVERDDGNGRSFSLSYRYGRNTASIRDNARIDANRLRTALDATACATTAGCALVDFFGAAGISEDALGYIAIPELRRKLTIREHEIAAAGALDLEFGGDREGRFAAGLEFRRISFADRDLTPPGAAPIGYFRGETLDADLETYDAYVQFDADLLRPSGFPGELDGSFAARLTGSSQHDAIFNFEAGLEWRAAPGVTLFTRRHFGERAPDIIELFSQGPAVEQTFVDPCGLPSSRRSAAVEANCASDGPLGVGPGFVQTEPLATVTIFGNPALRPERVTSAVYGLSLAPEEWAPSLQGRLELSAAWYDFKITDAVSTEELPLGACYASDDFSAPVCGVNPRTGAPSIVRDPVTRQIESFDIFLQNEAAFEWRGLDLEFRYAGEPAFPPFADSVWISALHTYTDRVISDAGTGERRRLEGLIDFPRHRTLATFGVKAGAWTFVAYASRRGRALTIRTDEPEARIPAAFYLDLTARLNLNDLTYLQAGVQNVTDFEPAITAYNEFGNFAAEFYDPIGRRYVAAFRVRF
jgi:outer membrane receptor protein involved in Fe transport